MLESGSRPVDQFAAVRPQVRSKAPTWEPPGPWEQAWRWEQRARRCPCSTSARTSACRRSGFWPIRRLRSSSRWRAAWEGAATRRPGALRNRLRQLPPRRRPPRRPSVLQRQPGRHRPPRPRSGWRGWRGRSRGGRRPRLMPSRRRPAGGGTGQAAAAARLPPTAQNPGASGDAARRRQAARAPSTAPPVDTWSSRARAARGRAGPVFRPPRRLPRRSPTACGHSARRSRSRRTVA